jgi:chromosomal replication initiator protein
MNNWFPEQKQPDRLRPNPDLSTVWQQIAEFIRQRVDSEVFDTLLSPIKITAHAEQEEIIAHVPNSLFYQRFLDEVFPLINDAKVQLGFQNVNIRLNVEQLSSVYQQISTSPDSSSKVNHNKSISNKSGLNPNYTFDSFVRGPSNQFAFAASLNVSDNPGQAYNPMFIYSQPGLGKTHLLHAIGNRILEKNPNAVVTVTTADTFLNEMIYCLRHNKMHEMRQKYRNCDALLVDDIQFLSGNKQATQEEFFHTFNALHGEKRQIVITSDKFPHEIPDLEERLRTRFQWGLIADIQPPDFEHRVAILYNKAEQIGIKLTQDVAEFIASKVKKNVRELEGTLHRIAGYSRIEGRIISKELAADILSAIVGDTSQRLTAEVIMKIVADYYNLKIPDLKSKRRHQNLTMPRQIAMYMTRNHLSSSFPEIGEKFGGKDHTTVMHAVKKITLSLKTDPDLRSQIENLERNLEQYK